MRKVTQIIFLFLLSSVLCIAQDPPSVSGELWICTGTNTTLTATGESGASFAWYDAETGGNLLSSSAILNTGTINSDIHFYVQQTTGAGTSARTDAFVQVAALPSPSQPTNVAASDSTICFGESTNLSATVDSANLQVVQWYDAPTGGTLLGTSSTGAPFTVSPTTTTTYYAQSEVEEFINTFNYTGGVQTFTVPAGVTSINVDAYGAQGGNTYSTTGPGLGGRVQATLEVTPGEILNIYVGGVGQSYAGYSSQLLGGWNGGGHGTNTGQGGGGGGATDIRIGGTSTNDRILVAGGAGGKGPTCSASGAKPHGGGLTGGSGSYCSGGSGELKRGRGGSQTTGGRPGCWHSNTSCATGGSFGYGGTGGSVGGSGRGGGGGGGWYGGGGGIYNSDGGGGSSYTHPSLCTAVTHTQGVRSGHGMLVITYRLIPVSCASTHRDSVMITVQPLPVVTASADVYNCHGDGVTLTVSGADSYSWSPSGLTDASINVDPSTTTTYTVTGTSNGCSNTDEVIVTVTDVVAPNDASFCSNDSVTLTATNGLNYTWMPGNISGASFIAKPTSTTTYTVTSEDPNGCITTDEVTLTVNPIPTVLVSNDTTIDLGSSANLNATGADTYVWTPGGSTSPSTSVNPITTTTYTVVGTDSSNGCKDSKDIIISVVPLPNVNGTMTVLAKETTTLTASGGSGATFAWYDALTGGNLLSTDASYTTGTIDTNTIIYVTLSENGKSSSRIPIHITAVDSSLYSMGAAESTICPSSSTDLGAALNSPGVINWYDAKTGGNLVGSTESGVGLNVSPSSTQMYYAEGETQRKVATFNYTGAVQTFTVPAGVTSIEIDAYGAQGGNTYATTGPGLGGRVQATLNVSPGDVLNIYVGGAGQSYAGYGSQLLGGWNGGGHGTNTGQGGGGGGATDIRIGGTSTNDRILVAGGAGGKGPTCSASGARPHGGGLTGGSGSYCTSGSGELKRGRGGSQTAGGRPGCWHNNSNCATSGGFGYGGTGGSVAGHGRSGGGGGGWYGGGGGIYNSDGGGGSSYTHPRLLQNVVHNQGVRSGHGLLTITYSKNSVMSSRDSVLITVEDSANPVPDVTNLPDAEGEDSVTLTPPTATDNCDGSIMATTDDPMTYNTVGTYTVTWDYEDATGNFVSQDQMVRVTSSLPVELISFAANCLGEQVDLSWSTASEQNSSHFQVQRSKDGVYWENMGRVESVGNSQAINDYAFTQQSREGYTLYRLKQVDIDGTTDYSMVVFTDCLQKEERVKLYPNPTSGQLSVALEGQQEEVLELHLMDELGKLLEQRVVRLDNGWKKEIFSLENYPAGFYELRVLGANQPSVHRIIKLD